MGVHMADIPVAAPPERGAARRTIRWERVPPLILGVFAVLCLITSLLNPLGEGYDEWAHFAYIRYVALERRLPASGQRLVPEIAWDATHHPPLYYVLGAAATRWVDMSDDLRPIANPHATVGRALNAYIHTRAEDFPFRGSVLAMYVARCVSTAMGMLTLWFSYRASRIVTDDNQALAAAAMATLAFMPQFVFTHSIITNDAAVTMFAALSLCLMLQMARQPSLRVGAGLWLAIAGAFLSKANGVALIPVGALVTARALWLLRHRIGPRRFRMALALAGLALCAAIGGLFLWERANTALEGHHSSVTGALERFILPALLGSSRTRQALFDWSLLPPGLTYMFRTFWASFGVGNVPAGEPFYWAMGIAIGLAGAGALVSWRRLRPRSRWLVFVCVLTGLALLAPPLFLIPVAKHVHVSPGRYAMPAAPVLAIGLAGGLYGLLRGRRRIVLPWLLAGGLLISAATMPWRYIRPAYAPARLLAQAELEEIAVPLDARFGPAMQLVGYAIADGTPQPGAETEVLLYWRCLAPISADFTVSVQALDANRRFYGGIDNYPGRGSYPTSQWQPGEIIEDRHRFVLGSDLPAPNQIQIKVDVYDLESGVYLPITAPEEIRAQTAAVFGRIAVPPVPNSRARIPGTLLASYGGAIELREIAGVSSLRPGTAEITLTWHCREALAEDYTVFVHLVDGLGRTIAQADGPPAEGRYPTDLWRRGDTVTDIHRIGIPADTPSGTYRLALGWYLLETQGRLPASDSQGATLAGGQLEVPVAIRGIQAP